MSPAAPLAWAALALLLALCAIAGWWVDPYRLDWQPSLAAREPKISLYGASKARAEELVEGSGLDWTIVRPPSLTDKPFTGHYRTRRDLNLRRNFAVSRADVAHLILAVSGDSDTYGHAIYIAS